MKIDRNPNSKARGVACGVFPASMATLFTLLILGAIGARPIAAAQRDDADELIESVLRRMIEGPAFDAKVRQTVWADGRQVIGVGAYRQNGGGSGAYRFELLMHDGVGKHRVDQVGDGRLVWTRTQIGDQVSVRRVDVGRLDLWTRGVIAADAIPPGRLVGGPVEMLETLRRDHELSLAAARLSDRDVVVITADLTDAARQRIRRFAPRSDWADLHPTRVRVAISADDDPETGFGAYLPVRIEYWSDPGPGEESPSPPRMISLVELYAIARMRPLPVESYRFDQRNADVHFVNETDRYIDRYGIQLTDKQRLQLRR